jgi:hypothetical protein
MRRSSVVLLLGFALIAPPLAGAATAHRPAAGKAISMTQRLFQYASTGAPPLSGSNSYVGSSDGRIGRASVHGALRGVNVYTGGGSFRGKNTIFDPAGSIRITFQAKVVAPGQIAGAGTFTGGTGKYKGARGSFTFTATQQSPTTFLRSLKGHIGFR